MMIYPRRSTFQTQRKPPDGFIVVAVLWLLAALSTLASIYSVYVVNTAAGFAVYDEQLRGERLVSAALELTAYQQLTQQPRLTKGQFTFQLGRANIAVKFKSEAARIDLNAAPKQLLIGLFRTLGAQPNEAEIYSDRVIAWRTRPPSEQNSEASAYQLARVGYQPRGAKFPHSNELSLVSDLPTPLVERALQLITVYSGRPQVNVVDATPEVLAALPGMTRDDLKAFLAERESAPEKAKDLLPKEAKQYATLDGSKAVRVTIQIVFDNEHKENAEVVILLTESDEQPFAVLSWHDDFNEITDIRQ
jgi:general secretion pathway protein K